MFVKLKHCALIFLIGFLLNSCNSNVCNQQMTSFMKVNFYNRTTKLDSAVDLINVKCLNCMTTDTLIKNASGDSSILLPLSALKDTSYSAFYITIDTIHVDTITTVRNDTTFKTPEYIAYQVRQDTLIAWYKRTNIFVSYECGFLPEFTIDSVHLNGKLSSDSVVIINKKVNTSNETNYKIYFTPVHHK